MPNIPHPNANTSLNLHPYGEGLIATQPIPKVAEQKIVPKNYEHL